MKKHEIIILLIAVAILAMGLSASVYYAIVDTAQAIEITITFLLVLVTVVYAKRTSDIARATEEQARVLRETISMSVRPFVSIRVLKILGGDTHPFEPPHELYFELGNTGKGPARNLVVRCEVQGGVVEYSEHELPSLNVGDTPRFSIFRAAPTSCDEVRAAYLLLRAIYNDELGESWFTELQIDRVEGRWKPDEVRTNRLLEDQLC